MSYNNLGNLVNPINADTSTDLKISPSATQPQFQKKQNIGADINNFLDAKGMNGKGLAQGFSNTVVGFGTNMGPLSNNTVVGQGLSMIENNTGVFGQGLKTGRAGVNILSTGLDGLFGKTNDTFYINQDTASQIGSDFGGSMDEMSKMAEKSGQKKHWWQKRDDFSGVKRTMQQMNNMAKDSRDTQQIAGNMHDSFSQGYQNKITGNTNYGLAAKLGTKIELLKARKKHKQGGQITWSPTYYEEIEQFKEGGFIEWSAVYYEDISEFKNGGKTEESKEEVSNQKSIIPEGALHAHKHHMENDENITKKGIPVVDNNGQQQAEIECDEIIFNLTITNQLEELYKEYYKEETTQKRKDELAIDAGKILTEEIINNVDDRTGLIDKCQKGGKL